MPKKRRLLKRSALAGLLLFFTACSSERDTNIALGTRVRVTGYLNEPKLASTSTKLTVKVIDPNGHRRAAENFAIDRTTGRFSVDITDDLLHAEVGASLPELWSAMGSVSPAPVNADNRFGGGSAGYARIEFVFGDLPAKSAGLTTFHHAVIPIVRAAALRSEKTLEIHKTASEGFTFELVGSRSIEVRDQKGNAVPEADVSVISYLNGLAVPSWRKPEWASTFSRTDDSGLARAYPIGITTAETLYQIAVKATGYCTFVSPIRVFSGAEADPEVIDLRTCSDEERLAPKPAFRAVFAPPTKTLKVADNGNRSTGYVNEERVNLDLDAFGEQLRGVEVLVYANAKPEGEVTLRHSFPAFSSRLNFAIPQVLGTQGGKDGPFVLAIRPIYTAADISRIGEPEYQYLYGQKSQTKPLLNEAEIKIQSAVGRDTIISGAGAPFFITAAPCPTGSEIGLFVGRFTPADGALASFLPCENFPIEINPTTLSFPSQKSGGNDVLRFFIKDVFGNISDSSDEDNRNEVYIDYGSADLNAQKVLLNADFGFAPRGSALGSDDAPYLFAAGTIVAKASLSSLVIRFASDSACRHLSPTSADGSGDSSLGNRIDSFYIAGVEPTEDNDADRFRKCGNDFPLNSTSVRFPTSTTADAEFVLRIRDYAGNRSNFGHYKLPPCGNTPANFIACWAP